MPASAKDEALTCVVSYLFLRKAVGIIGVALPFVLVVGRWMLQGWGMLPSLSGYYYTSMRDVFVGALCAIGVFLLSYRGYERIDDIAGNLACVFAVGVALFPTDPPSGATPLQITIGHVHLTFAALFFLTLAYFSLVLFTKTHPNGRMSGRKKTRNAVYRVCGWTIVACIALVVLDVVLLQHTAIQAFHPVLALESLMVWAFGISWLVKGEAILKDVEKN